MTETNLIDQLSLPNHYLQKIYGHLENLAKEAIDDGDLHTANRLLSLVIAVQGIKSDSLAKQESEAKQSNVTDTPKQVQRPRYIGYDAETKEMRDAIIGLVQKNLLNTNVDISSRTLYSIIQQHHLCNMDRTKLDNLTLPMSESRPDRPVWKEAVTQALLMMISEGLLEKVGRYSYSWTDKAKNDLSEEALKEVSQQEESIPPQRNISREEYVETAVPSDVKLPQPFAVFSKPKIYGQESNNHLASRNI